MPRSIPDRVAAQVRHDARQRCGYCRAPQSLIPAPLEIEHILPRAKGGSDAVENLWLACRLCNVYKSDQIEAADPESGVTVALFNPRQQVWAEHFQWNEDATLIVGLTASGRATVQALNLNNPFAVTARSHWVKSKLHPAE